MRSLLVALVTVMAVADFGAAQSEPGSRFTTTRPSVTKQQQHVINADEMVLRRLIEDSERFSTNDPQSLAFQRNYLGDSITVLTPLGQLGHATRDQVLAGMAARNQGSAKADISNLRVHLYGDTAVVTYDMRLTTAHSDPRINVRDNLQRCTETFIKRNARWQVISSATVSANPIPPEVYDAARRGTQQQAQRSVK